MKSNPSVELVIDGFLSSRLVTMHHLSFLLPERASAGIGGRKRISAVVPDRSQQEVADLKPAARKAA